MLLELDEELHFNRYRYATLDRAWAHRLPWRDTYLHLSQHNESDCLRAGSWGKRWTTGSCEAMFGAADPPGRLASFGAPRWKQRALYDAMKDAYALSGPDRLVARVSVHDRVAGTTLGHAIEGRTTIDAHHVFALVRSRTLNQFDG